jgi:hypothetical protein
MLGGLEPDERRMLNDLIQHFVMALNKERDRSAELEGKLAAMAERVTLLEAAAYGAF